MTLLNPLLPCTIRGYENSKTHKTELMEFSKEVEEELEIL
jgi:hypothetical protein